MHQPCQDQFLLLPNFSHNTLEAFVRFESSLFSKTMIFVFHQNHHKATKSSQNTKIMNLPMHQPCQDQFLLVPNFSHITLEAFLSIECSQFSKTMIFVFHQNHHQPTKSSQNTKIMKLAMHQPCQDQFLLLPNFSHTTLEAFVRIESSQFSKTMIFVFHQNHYQPTKSSQNTKIINLAMHQPCQDQFLLLPNFSHITLEAFVNIGSSQFSKTMIFVFHQNHHQATK